ncbi:amidohydrolase family protein [Candidatus Bathyarchaeota archaeon]|nr:amidohydrolase family protein [Candidatus Bathyarchaeota archaeon]
MKEIGKPDLILIEGKIITVDHEDTLVEAVAIKDGKILATGTSGEISEIAGSNTKIIDLKGKTAMPGIIDSHTHPSSIASRYLEVDCRAPPIKNITQILDKIRHKAKELEPDQWIRGANFNESKLEENRHITRWELDEAAPNNPVFIIADTGHQALVNTKAMEIAGIDENTPDPPGGEIERSPEGVPTGLLYENAMGLVRDNIPEYSIDDLKESYKDVVAKFSEWGITTTHNASSHRNGIRAYKQLLDEGTKQLRMRLMMSVNRNKPGDVLDALELAGIESGLGDDWLQVMSVKIMGDGSGAGGTCCVFEPQNRGTKGLGIWMTEPEEVNRLVNQAHKAGLRVSIHSIGDRGIDMALDCIERAQKEIPVDDMRHRIEHNSLCTPKQLKRIKELGVTPSSSIGYMYGLGDQYSENFGPERSRWLHPHKTMMEMGIIAGGNSDCPVTYYSPFVQIYEAVTRKTSSGKLVSPEERISPMDAIRVYTWNGAYLGKDEEKLGSIEQGKLADIIVLDRDILTIPEDEIKDIQVVMTIVDGKIVYKRD